jgi:hypothetical protein
MKLRYNGSISSLKLQGKLHIDHDQEDLSADESLI